MVNHYNAFISYRHAPSDIAVATAIQKELEHYSIPGPIKKKTGIKKIERIFRDKDELPITSDLSDDISNALEHADYLIVICSTHTNESIWVKREIEFFLKNHSRKQILTVLVDGEPQDVIPEILLTDTKEIQDENGNIQTINVNLEPLSCDYRMGIKKAKREELPRLAAALLSCSYDELMNRNRQYKMRRLTYIFVAILLFAVVFAGYTLYNRNEIKKNYDAAMRSRSLYLANESRILLEKEQRIQSLQLALEALPKDEEDRPVIPEALSAITKATLAYTSPKGLDIHSVWNYSMNDNVKDFTVSDDSLYLAAYDSTNTLQIWDTTSHMAVETPEMDEVILNIEFFQDHTLLILTQKHLYAYDVSQQKNLWQIENTEASYALSSDLTLKESGKILIHDSQYNIYSVDPADGSTEVLFKLETDDIMTCLSNYALSPDQKNLLVSTDNYNTGNTLFLYNTENNETIEIPYGEGKIKNYIWLNNTTYCIASSPKDNDPSSTNGTAVYYNTSEINITCYSLEAEEPLWSQQFQSTNISAKEAFVILEDSEKLLYYSGNTSTIYNMKDGSILYLHNTNDTIIDVSDVDGDAQPLYITKGGYIDLPFTDRPNALSATKSLADNIDQVIVNNGIYVNQILGHEIIFYSLNVIDEEWTAFEGNASCKSIDDYQTDDTYFSCIAKKNENVHLLVFNVATETLQADIRFDQMSEFTGDYDLVGSADNHIYLVCDNSGEMKLLDVTISDGSYNTIKLPDDASLHRDLYTYADKKIYYYVDGENGYDLKVYNLSTKEEQTYSHISASSPYTAPICNADQTQIIIFAEEPLLLNTTDGSTHPLVETEKQEEQNYGINTSYFGAFDLTNAENLAYTDGFNIYAYGKENALQSVISCNGQNILGLTYLPTEDNSDSSTLLAFYDSGRIEQYDTKTGDCIGAFEYTTYAYGNKALTFEYDKAAHLLYVTNQALLCMIDTESFLEIAYIENCYGHTTASDRFISVKYDDNYYFGFFNHYTLDDLKLKAAHMLENADMTAEFKNRYGIE